MVPRRRWLSSSSHTLELVPYTEGGLNFLKMLWLTYRSSPCSPLLLPSPCPVITLPTSWQQNVGLRPCVHGNYHTWINKLLFSYVLYSFSNMKHQECHPKRFNIATPAHPAPKSPAQTQKGNPNGTHSLRITRLKATLHSGPPSSAASALTSPVLK